MNLYKAIVSVATLQELQSGGYDIVSIESTSAGTRVEMVLSNADRRELRAKGINVSLVRDRKGRTQAQRIALQSEGGFTVYRSYDEEGGIRDEMNQLAADHDFVKKRVMGTTHQGREYIALKVTENADSTADGSRPAVLYVSTYHAREWISTEVNRRLLNWYIDEYQSGNAEVQDLLSDTELWFVLVHNPDGYQYTFDHERLWRKNLRDNNTDGQITSVDGVDPNRNHAEHWNYDEEGSSGQFSDQTYRGPSPNSEPETLAMVSLFNAVPFKFAISYHSFGPLLLYTQGWQVQTPSADDPIYVALTGTDTNPAVPGFDPGVGADLYTTNGEFTDWAHADRNTLAWTPELEEGCAGCGFVFPDSEAAVQAQFEKNLQFALNVARSAHDPDDPVSHAGIDTQDFYLDVSKTDRWKTNNPSSDLEVDISYAGGSSQPVEVLAKKSLSAVSLQYRVNGGPTQSATTSPTAEGEVYGGNNAYNTYYHYLTGNIPGLQVGNNVEYWFTSGGSSSDHATFKVVEDDDADVLVVAAEDRTGLSNPGPGYTNTKASGSPNFLSYYTNALDANGVEWDLYDVDANGRQAPDHLGVMSHYDAVLWYTGNDFVTRRSGRGPGNVDRLANDMILEMRAHLNAGGTLLYTGKYAGAVSVGVAGAQYYDPVSNIRCVTPGGALNARCQLFSDKDDFLQYYLGAYIYNDNAGTGPTGPFPIDGVDDPFTALSWNLNGPDSANNQDHTAALVSTSTVLPETQYPQFASDAPAVWRTGAAGAFQPVDGSKYIYSQRADITYKRLMRSIDLSALSEGDPASLQFKISYDTEPAWDFVFVEAHTVGEDDWTTLPEANGKTSQGTGDSCPEGWHELHPWLARYQGADCSGSNASTGGEWWADSGRSAGWEQWEIDLSEYAGSQIEVSISYASDWAIQGLGAFVDDIVVSTGEGTTSFEDDAEPMDGWTVPGGPEGSAENANDWTRTGDVGIEEGAAVSTDDTLYFGFGFEGIRGAANRAAVMDRIITYLT